ncbi:MAG: VWA domain-containing protein [Alphaproteobacteria bacterium]|nr:VWA domain-containing protein [Alphaproteobacteria bacterium]
MLVFDASGSMAGTDRLGVSTPVPVTRIDKLRSALANVLPSAARYRRIGLITYGPGPYHQCNVQLNFAPMANATEALMYEVNSLNPAGKTPLVAAVSQAAEVLKFREKPGMIVVVTDGEETCGGEPCELGKRLHDDAMQLTVHVIGYRVKDFSWTGEQSIGEVKCLADKNGGLYINAESEQDLIEALEKTLGCPMLSQNTLR